MKSIRNSALSLKSPSKKKKKVTSGYKQVTEYYIYIKRIFKSYFIQIKSRGTSASSHRILEHGHFESKGKCEVPSCACWQTSIKIS